MKSRNGQVLVLFLMILPILVLGVCAIIDSSYMLYHKNRLDNINRDVLQSINEKENLNEEDIRKLIYLNDAKIVNEDIVIDKTITIDNYIYINSIFGHVIGIDNYKVSSKVSINYNN